MNNRCEEEKEAARDGHKEAQWTINAILERNTLNVEERRRKTETRLNAVLEQLAAFRGEASDLWEEWEPYLGSALKTSAGPRIRTRDSVYEKVLSPFRNDWPASKATWIV